MTQTKFCYLVKSLLTAETKYLDLDPCLVVVLLMRTVSLVEGDLLKMHYN